MVWGGISKRGATGCQIFEGIMKAPFYTQSILGEKLLPFIRQVYPNSHRFQQDNDPKHTSRLAQQFMEENGINWWRTPPESPDLNPIEKLWKELKDYVSNVRSKEELIGKIEEFWEGLTPERCQDYINHIHETMEKVIQADGGPSGE